MPKNGRKCRPLWNRQLGGPAGEEGGPADRSRWETSPSISIDQRRAETLHRVAACPAAPLAARQISVDQLLAELCEGDAAGFDTGADRGLAVGAVGGRSAPVAPSTSWVRPESVSRHQRASPLEGGLGRLRAPFDHDPRCRRRSRGSPGAAARATACPLARALASTTSRGSPSLVSSTSGGIAVNRSPSDFSSVFSLRRARGRG